MKQVSYDFNWTDIIPAIVSRYEVENGFWRVELIVESLTGVIPHTVVGQIQTPLPGYVGRVVGFKLISAATFGYMTFYVEDGTVSYGTDPDQRGPEEGSGGPGGDPGPIAAGF